MYNLLNYFLADIEVNRLDISVQLSAEECITNASLPTCNRNATNVKDVYNIYDIIPKSKLEMLYEHAVEILKGPVEGYANFSDLTNMRGLYF